MSAVHLRRVVAAGDEQEARRAIRACGERLRAGLAEEREELVLDLALLARHASAIVRLAVADVCDAFPDDTFDATHARLLEDPDHYVRAAAEAAGHRRAKRRRQAAKGNEEERVLAEILGEIESGYTKGARKLAERAVERGVERFAAQLEHEVGKTRTPIHVALTQALTEIERPERSLGLARDRVAVARERIGLVFSMVRRAREYATQMKPSFADESLAAIVDEAHAQVVARLGPRGAKLAFQAEVDGALRAVVDRYALLQALLNLVQNAAESYPEETERLVVRVSAQAQRGGSEIELRIADEGRGIGKEERETLFVPFGSLKPGGTGVGLLIVRRMIEEVHGGKLTIESTPGEGTTMRIVLPAKQGGR
jgi:signal transduction histidine kinase